MFTFHVDLGQLIIASLTGIVGWFVKKKIESYDKRIEKHENLFFRMNGDLQSIIGFLGIERRNHYRREEDAKT